MVNTAKTPASGLLLREARRAQGQRSRSAPSAREEGLLMGLHGGLVYHLGVLPLCYGQGFRGQGDAVLTEAFIRDRVQGYLAQVGRLLAEQFPAAAGHPMQAARAARAA